jgi:hypothetical protein
LEEGEGLVVEFELAFAEGLDGVRVKV